MVVTESQKKQVRAWIYGLEERVHWMQSLSLRPDAWERDLGLRLAAERALHTSVEYVTDIASLIIDALVMRDPGGYADIVKVLVEEDVLTQAWFKEFEGVFELRARFIRDHDGITPAEVRLAIMRYPAFFPEFVQAIQAYLQL